MPILAIANPKGGTGKTTIALSIAQVLNHRGATVKILEADPNRPLEAWSGIKPAAIPVTLQVITGVDEGTFVEIVKRADAEADWVIIDPEGSKNIVMAYAIAVADLVVIPLQGSQLDADQAIEVVRMINDHAQINKRTIPYCLLFTRTTVLQPRDFTHILKELDRASLPVMGVQFTERAAFRAMLQTGDTLYTLDERLVHNPVAAIENAEAVVDAILRDFVREAA